MKRLFIVFIVCVMFVSCIYSYDCSLSIEDFSIDLNGKTYLIGESFNEIFESLSNNELPSQLVDYGWNVYGYAFNGLEITYIDGPNPKSLFSIIITSPAIKTSRGISVGQTREDVYKVYPILFDDDNYILNGETNIILQRIFHLVEFVEEGLDSIESFEGGLTKTYAITFELDPSDIITKIVINVAY